MQSKSRLMVRLRTWRRRGPTTTTLGTRNCLQSLDDLYPILKSGVIIDSKGQPGIAMRKLIARSDLSHFPILRLFDSDDRGVSILFTWM